MQTDKETLKSDPVFKENIKFYKDTLDAHNELRALHNAKELCLNLKLCKQAQACADRYAFNSCITNEEDTIYDEILGENTAFQFSHSKKPINDPKFLPTTAHLTQIIWKNTTDVGFGRARSEDGSYYMVAKYYPAGNVSGEFSENIEPPIK